MGTLLRSFTYPRNAFARTADESAQKVLDVIDRARRDDLIRVGGEIKDEPYNDVRLLSRAVTGTASEPSVTKVGERYVELARQSPRGAWRWLLTRSMWLYSFPNDTNAAASKAAQDLGVRFNFFDLITRLVVHLSALPQPDNTLYFDELLMVLDDDVSWGLNSEDLHDRVLEARRQARKSDPGDHAGLLDDLEPHYGLGRDYANTIFRKAFGQCGLFQMIVVSQSVVGMRLSMAAYDNPVFAQRLRFVLDNPRIYGTGGAS